MNAITKQKDNVCYYFNMKSNRFNKKKPIPFNISSIILKEIALEDIDFNMTVFNDNQTDVIEKSIRNIFDQISNDEKDVLIIFNNKKINIELEKRIIDIVENNKANNKVIFCEENKIDRDHIKKFNIIIEIPFSSYEKSNSYREYFEKNISYNYKNQFITFVNVNLTSIFDVFKIKLSHLNTINIVNISSNYYSNIFFSSNKIPLHGKLKKYFEGKPVINIEANNSNSDLIGIKEKKDELFKKYNKNLIIELVELIKNNNDLKLFIFRKFISEKQHLVWKDKDTNVSLMNGKKGYINVVMIPPTKQREDRYFIYKVLLKYNLLEDPYDIVSLLRVHESFDHVTSFPETIIEKVFEKCKEHDIKVEIINELPFIYESPLINFYEKNKPIKEILSNQL